MVSQTEIDYRLFVELNPDWVWQLDAQGNYCYSNSSVFAMLGYQPEQVIGQSFFEFFVQPAHVLTEQTLRQGTRLQGVRSRFRHVDGHSIELESVLLPIFDALGQLQGYRGCHRDISYRSDMEQQLKEAEKLIGMGIWELDLQSQNQVWSDGIYAILGEPAQSFSPTFDQFMTFLPVSDRDKVEGAMQEALIHRQSYDLLHNIVRRSGEIRQVHARATIIFKNEQPVKMLGSVVDITDQVKLQQQAEDTVHLLNSVIDNVNNLIFYKSTDYVYMGCNRAFEQFMGHRREELIGHTDFDFFPPDVAQHFRSLDAKIFENKQRVVNPQWVTYPDGSQVFLHTITTPFYDKQGNIIGLVGNSVDLTSEKLLSEQLEKQALTDGLTGIANRTLFMHDLELMLAQAERSGTRFALLFLDLDGFKPINDNYGHRYGDAVLAEVAHRLRAGVRKNDLVARLGGDEFGVLLWDVKTKQQAIPLIEALIAKIAEPIEVDGLSLSVSASVGVAFNDQKDERCDKLLSHADDAMYVAKKSGKNKHWVYEQAD